MFSIDMFLTHCDLSLFQLTGMFQFTVRLMSELEARFTSVERMDHYIKVNVQTDRTRMFYIGIAFNIGTAQQSDAIGSLHPKDTLWGNVPAGFRWTSTFHILT